MEFDLLFAAGLGLLAFVEPCSIGIHLLLIGHLERLRAARRLAELAKIALVRAFVLGSVGLAGAFVGQALFGAQRLLWGAFGLLYIALGAVYLTGRQAVLMRRFGSDPGRLEARSRALGLGVAFGL